MFHQQWRMSIFLLLAPALCGAVCDQCFYDGNDVTPCFDYGLFDNSKFVKWSTGSQDCKDTFNIKVSTPFEPAVVCASANSFVNNLKNGYLAGSTARLGLGVATGKAFFTQDSSNRVVLEDSITIGGTSTDCETSQSDCYNAMKPYFGTTAGKKEMDDVCGTLYATLAKDQQVEEATLRKRLCDEYRLASTNIPSSGVCSPLMDELLEYMNANTGRECQAFAFGIQNRVVPGCENRQPASDGSIVARQPMVVTAMALVSAGVLFL